MRILHMKERYFKMQNQNMKNTVSKGTCKDIRLQRVNISVCKDITIGDSQLSKSIMESIMSLKNNNRSRSKQ